MGETHGKPRSDACISWDTTVQVLDKLRAGVRARRALLGANGGGRKGIDNRVLATASERASSAQGVRDFNDPAQFPAA